MPTNEDENLKEILGQDEFIQFQRKKFMFRRIIAYGANLFYVAATFYLFIRVPFELIENYLGFFVQLTLFAVSVNGYYFAGSTFEEIKINKEALMTEFSQVSDVNMVRDRKDRRQQNEPDCPPTQAPGDENG